MLQQKIKNWKHIFKLDPNRSLSDLALKAICQSQTDGIIIGGTDGITYQNTSTLLSRVKKWDQFCVQEVSHINAVIPGFDGYFIPAVLNTDQSEWFLGAHFQAIKKYGNYIPWDRVVLEGYIICNPRAKVSQRTKAKTTLNQHDIIAYARLADQLYKMPLVYIEYSGAFGDLGKVSSVKKTLTSAQLFYGGGIKTESQVKQLADWVDTIVVGNVIYDDLSQALATVSWAKNYMTEN